MQSIYISGGPGRGNANVSEQQFSTLDAAVAPICSQITTFGHQRQSGCAAGINTAAGPKMTPNNMYSLKMQSIV